MGLTRGVTIQPLCIQAVYGTTKMNEGCVLRERPVQIAKKGLRIHNAPLKTNARQDFRFHITNLSDKPVNVFEGNAVGILDPSDGSVSAPPGR